VSPETDESLVDSAVYSTLYPATEDDLISHNIDSKEEESATQLGINDVNPAARKHRLSTLDVVYASPNRTSGGFEGKIGLCRKATSPLPLRSRGDSVLREFEALAKGPSSQKLHNAISRELNAFARTVEEHSARDSKREVFEIAVLKMLEEISSRLEHLWKPRAEPTSP